eukprot:scaffold34129_cov32-Tisochrysis_lutea.AAC.5
MPRVSNVEIYFALASTSMGAIIEQQRRMPRREGGAVAAARKQRGHERRLARSRNRAYLTCARARAGERRRRLESGARHPGPGALELCDNRFGCPEYYPVPRAAGVRSCACTLEIDAPHLFSLAARSNVRHYANYTMIVLQMPSPGKTNVE